MRRSSPSLSPEREGTAGAPLARVPWSARTVGAGRGAERGWGEGTGRSHRNDSERTRLRTHPHPPYGHLPPDEGGQCPGGRRKPLLLLLA
ncbi:hypothetical protein XapA_00610 [Xanthomonas citri pv. punicae]|nr:hypothetical protein XapA_00610 [Xanthomonas citri pv. punicae]